MIILKYFNNGGIGQMHKEAFKTADELQMFLKDKNNDINLLTMAVSKRND